MRVKSIGLALGLAAGLLSATGAFAQLTATPASKPYRAQLWWTDFTLRTFQAVNGGRAEVAGGTCTISGRDFEGSVQSPAVIRVPIFRPGRQVFTVSCTLNGQIATGQRICTYSAGEPRAIGTVSVSSCNQPTVAVTFAAQ